MDWISSSSSPCWAWAREIFLPVLSQHPAGAVQGLQPNADLQALLLLVQGDELLRLFRLEAQGLHPALQLREDVPQAHQVLLSLVQAALRLLFAVAVAGDARRLLKKFSRRSSERAATMLSILPWPMME